jgi:hypothetical protein
MGITNHAITAAIEDSKDRQTDRLYRALVGIVKRPLPWRSVSHGESAIGDREREVRAREIEGKMRMMGKNGKRSRAYIMAQRGSSGKNISEQASRRRAR